MNNPNLDAAYSARWAIGLKRAGLQLDRDRRAAHLAGCEQRKADRTAKYHGPERRKVAGTAADRRPAGMSDISAMFHNPTLSTDYKDAPASGPSKAEVYPAWASEAAKWLTMLAINLIALTVLAGVVGYFDSAEEEAYLPASDWCRDVPVGQDC